MSPMLHPCEALIGEIERKFGPVSVLVNNAGITRDNLAMRMKDEEWDMVIETNLKAVFRLSKLVMRGMMKARFGRIINITSVVGEAGNPGQANYAAAKAGVAGMSRALAQELGQSQYYRKLCGARLHRYRHDPRPAGRATRCAAGPDSRWVASVSLKRSLQLLHFLPPRGAGYITGKYPKRQWRHVHGLSFAASRDAAGRFC
jgi:hypothetical protein